MYALLFVNNFVPRFSLCARSISVLVTNFFIFISRTTCWETLTSSIRGGISNRPMIIKTGTTCRWLVRILYHSPPPMHNNRRIKISNYTDNNRAPVPPPTPFQPSEVSGIPQSYRVRNVTILLLSYNTIIVVIVLLNTLSLLSFVMYVCVCVFVFFLHDV